MNRIKTEVKLENAIKRLIGLHCWSIIAGKGTWPAIDLDFGNKIPRETPLKNKYLSEEQRCFTGEFSIFIECNWRIESETEVLTGAMDSMEKNALKKLFLLKDSLVSRIYLTKPAFDLNIYFDNGLVLKLFCDETNKTEEDDNWSFHSIESVYIVGCRSIVREELTENS